MRNLGIAVFALVLLLPLESSGQRRGRAAYAGLILEITGRCTLKPVGGTAFALHKQRHHLKKLYVGDTVSCEKDSYVVLELAREPASAEGSEGNGSRTTVEPMESLEVPMSSAPRRDGFGPTVTGFDIGGTWRSDGSEIYAPAEGEHVRAQDFSIRRSKRADSVVMSVTLTADRGQELWAGDGIRAEAGMVAPPGARDALAHYRDDQGTGPVEMYVTDSAGRRFDVSFYVMSRDEERRLSADLEFCDTRAKDIMLALCRIGSFERARAFNDVAAAYDSALPLAPESEDLITNAITAHLRVGDLDRVNDLKEKLRAAQ